MSLHLALALASAGMAAGVGLEAALRGWRNVPPGRLAAWLQRLTVMLLGITSAGGLGLLAGGAAPREGLHFVYALVAIAIVPVGGSLFARVPARARAIAAAFSAVVVLGVILRLFQTG